MVRFPPRERIRRPFHDTRLEYDPQLSQVEGMLLGCPSCKHPYDGFPGGLHAPFRVIRWKNTWTPFVVKCYSCVDEEKARIAWCLLDLTKTKGLYKQFNGYVADGHVTPPKCTLCLQDYLGNRQPMALKCGFVMCGVCIKARTYVPPICPFCASDFFDVDLRVVHYDVPLTCVYRSLVVKIALHNARVAGNRLQHHAETEKHNQPRKEIANAPPILCENCYNARSIEDVFKCTECDVRVCGACAFRYHAEHRESTVDLLDVEIQKLKGDVIANFKNVSDCYRRDLRGHSAELFKAMDSLDVKFGRSAERLNGQKTMWLAGVTGKELNEVSADFESHCEELTPVIRKVTHQIQDLTDRLA
ncbi:unnamed protein product, partial [Mesorhabditis spiculigera]